MSYERYVELLCERGHLATWHVYEFQVSILAKGSVCPHCGGRWAQLHHVDLINELRSAFPYETGPAPLQETGFVDVPHYDHRGNFYVTKLVSYEPIPGKGIWVSLKSDILPAL